jgi:hypothetical protein
MITKRSKLHFLCAISLIAGSAQAAEPAGFVAFLEGNVQVNGKAARQGLALDQGDRIRVGKGRVTLILDRDRVVHLGANSSVLMEQLKAGTAVEVKLDYGVARNLIKKGTGETRSFKVKAASAVMGVRGTQFAVELPASGSATGEGLRVATFEGQVAVWSNAQQAQSGAQPQAVVSAGQALRAAGPGGAMPPVAQLSEREMREVRGSIPQGPGGPPPPPLAPGFGAGPPPGQGAGFLPPLSLDFKVD